MTRRINITISDELDNRWEPYKDKIKPSELFQAALSAALDQEEERGERLREEQASLAVSVSKLMMADDNGATYERGKDAGWAWAKAVNPNDVSAALASNLAAPFPLELNVQGTTPKSLIKNDMRLNAFLEAMFGHELLEKIYAMPEDSFVLSPAHKAGALVWIQGWNDALEEFWQELANNFYKKDCVKRTTKK